MKNLFKNSPIPISVVFSLFLSAVLLRLAFPCFDIELFAWIALVPFIRKIKSGAAETAPVTGFCFGVLFYTMLLCWIRHVSMAGMIALSLYLSLYPAVFAFILVKTIYSAERPVQGFRAGARPFLNAVFAGSLWVLLEYVQGHLLSGFAWAFLGYSQYKNILIAQIADMCGVYGVSFLIMSVNVLVAEILEEAAQKKVSSVLNFSRASKVSVLCMSVLLALVAGYGARALRAGYPGKRVSISLIQGNIPQHQKWDEAFTPFIMSKYRALTKIAALTNPDMVVWPETATPGYLNEKMISDELESLSTEINAPVLTGTPYYSGRGKQRRYFNAAVLVSPSGERQMYKKIHLVPFGEFAPFGSFFRRMIIPEGMVSFTPGDEYTIFNLRDADSGREASFGTLICFEDVFPGLVRNFVKAGAHFMVTITNDAWFMRSSAAYQHLACGVFRAVENRRWMLRAANTGVSCYISPTGIVAKYLDDFDRQKIFKTLYATCSIDASDRISLYTRFGDIWLIFALAFILYFGYPYYGKKPSA